MQSSATLIDVACGSDAAPDRFAFIPSLPRDARNADAPFKTKTPGQAPGFLFERS
jgi:hypothetical protein